MPVFRTVVAWTWGFIAGVAISGCGGSVPAADTLWHAGLPATRAGPSGSRWLRSIVHLHSPLSHDACDGAGWVEGVTDAACAADLKRAACALHVDVVQLTDHPAHMAEVNRMADLLLVDLAAGDRLRAEGEAEWLCADGHRVTVLLGFEDRLMPLGLVGHAAEVAGRDVLYHSADATAAAALRAAGALVAIPHSESRTADDVEAVAAEVLEIGNHHAVIDPDIRRDHLGLDPLSAVVAVFKYALTPDVAPHPDLVWLDIYTENRPALDLWRETWPHRHATGVYGCDAHQNVAALPLADEERGDSYRRMMRWATNWVQIRDGKERRTPWLESLRAGNSMVVFEALGTPNEFSVRLGDDGRTLTIEPPTQAEPFGPVRADWTLLEWSGGQEKVRARGFGRAAIRLAAGATVRVEFGLYPADYLGRFLGVHPQRFLGRYPWIVMQPMMAASE